MCLSSNKPIMNRVSIPGRPLSLYSGAISPSIQSQSILPASCTSSCFMLMICSSRARDRSADPVISCFFGRIAPSDASQNHDLQDEQIQKTICKLLRPQMPKSCNLNTEAAPKSDSCSTTYELFTANYLFVEHAGQAIWYESLDPRLVT